MLEAVHLCLFYLSDACLSLGWGREVVQDSTSCGSNRVKERNRFLQVSGFVLCLGFLPPTPHPFYTVCMTGNGFLWITSHTKEMSLLFPKSLTFPVAWAGSLQVLPGFESQRQFWLSKVVCPPALYPPFASGVEAGHNSKTGTVWSFSSCDNGWQRSIVLPGWRSRGIYPSSLYHNSAGLPILCCFYSLGTEQAMHLMKVWHCLCPCQSCRQAGVCSALQPLRRSSGLLLQGFASRSWLVLFWAQPATCAQSLYIVHILQTCLLSLIWQPCEGEILHLGFMRFLLFSRFLLGSFSHIYEEINRGSIWVAWKCIYHLLPSATYTTLSSVEDFQEGGGVLVGEYEAYRLGTRLCWITCVISTLPLFLQVQETNQDVQWP